MKKVIFILVSLFFATIANAAVDKTLIKNAEDYLNSVTGLAGNFSQNANGTKDSGTFSMLRPGRVRLDYKKSPVQLISDGSDLYFFDKSLDQITTVPLKSTPAGILIRKKINLHNADIVVTETTTYKDTFGLRMHFKDNPGLGNMFVVFDKAPVKLNSWVVTDATRASTSIKFSNLKPKTDFVKNYFQIARHKTVSTSGGDSYYE